MKRQAVFCTALLCAAVLLTGCGAQDESAGQGTDSSGVEQIAADGVVKMDSGAGTEETEDRAGEEPSEILAGAETDEATGEVSGSTQDSGEIPAGSEVIPAEGTDPEEAAPPPEYLIQNFPIIYQMPELPTGCEVTALTMAMNYYGCAADKVEMASRYLPVASANLYYGADGRQYGTDLRQYFVGDPASDHGIICGTGAIITAADGFFSANGIPMQAVDMTGAAPEELYALVSQDTPVLVWVTIGMEDRRETQGWYTETGDYVDWSTNDHGAVLIGYTETTVTIGDPISGQVEYDRQQFESVFASRGNQCVILEEE